MKSAAKTLFLTTLLFCLALPLFAHAETYPYVPMGTDDVRVIEDPRLDIALRLALIARAKHTIDVSTYDIRQDNEAGFPILNALRDAANRGVRVRFAVTWISQLLMDNTHVLARYLTSPPTQEPIQVLLWGGTESESDGWSAFDNIHEKLFVVDGKYALTTGRGFGEVYFYWLDTSFAIKGALAIETQQMFDHFWDTLAFQHSLFGDRLPFSYDWAPHSVPNDVSPDGEKKADVSQLLTWFDIPANDTSASGRALHMNLIEQLSAIAPGNESSLGSNARVRALDDPIVDAVSERLKTAQSVRMDILFAVLHPKLKEALLETAKRPGTSITLLVNTNTPSLTGHEKSPIFPGGPAWAFEITDIDDLLAAGIKVYRFQTNPTLPWVYVHRKLAVIDDTVFFGSHNFNLPSTTSNDEASFEIKNPDLARRLSAIFDLSLKTNGSALDSKRVHSERNSFENKFLRMFSSPLEDIL